jgi:hypothetical protein
LNSLLLLCSQLQIAIEFTTASVTAPGVDLLAAKLPGDTPRLLDVAERGLHISNNASMHYSNIRQRGEADKLVITDFVVEMATKFIVLQ